MELLKERIEELETGIKQLRSQLIDGGMLEDSIVIISIDNLLK